MIFLNSKDQAMKLNTKQGQYLGIAAFVGTVRFQQQYTTGLIKFDLKFF